MVLFWAMATPLRGFLVYHPAMGCAGKREGAGALIQRRLGSKLPSLRILLQLTGEGTAPHHFFSHWWEKDCAACQHAGKRSLDEGYFASASFASSSLTSRHSVSVSGA